MTSLISKEKAMMQSVTPILPHVRNQADGQDQSLKQSIMTKSPVVVSMHEEMNPSRRCSMEDCCVFAPPGTWDAPSDDMAYLGVYDGHGGRDMVEYLEHGLQYHVAQELQHQDDASIPLRLERAFLMADIHSKQLGVTMSGATVAVCLVSKQSNNTITLHTANAGDARIVLGHDGKATRMTKDHRTDDPEEIDRIDRAGGFIFKGRVLGVLAVTRSLGDHCMKDFVIAKPFVSERTIQMQPQSPPSFLILACDGFWDVFDDQEAVNLVLQFTDVKEDVSKHLIAKALGRGSTDNISVVVAWL